MIKWKKAQGRKRQHKVEVRLNDIEYEKLKNDIVKMNTTISDYLRKLIIGVRVKAKPGYEFYEVMKQMTKIGVNLNQIARKANQTNEINREEYIRQSKEWNRFMNKVKDEFL